MLENHYTKEVREIHNTRESASKSTHKGKCDWFTTQLITLTLYLLIYNYIQTTKRLRHRWWGIVDRGIVDRGIGDEASVMRHRWWGIGDEASVMRRWWWGISDARFLRRQNKKRQTIRKEVFFFFKRCEIGGRASDLTFKLEPFSVNIWLWKNYFFWIETTFELVATI